MLKLWEISNEILMLTDRLEESGGELTGDLESEWDRIGGQFMDKAEKVALYINQLQAFAEAAKSEERRIGELRQSFQFRADRLKDYLRFHMDRCGEKRIETPLVKLTIAKNSRPSIRWEGEGEPPAPFQRVTVSLDGPAVYETWKKEGSLPYGFTVEQGTHLRIK